MYSPGTTGTVIDVFGLLILLNVVVPELGSICRQRPVVPCGTGCARRFVVGVVDTKSEPAFAPVFEGEKRGILMLFVKLQGCGVVILMV